MSKDDSTPVVNNESANTAGSNGDERRSVVHHQQIDPFISESENILGHEDDLT